MELMAIQGTIQPGLLGRINEWRVLRTLQQCGPLSRADLARLTGTTAPTASKAVEALLREGWLIEDDAPDSRRGRPAKRLRLRSESVLVLGLVIDTPECHLVAASLDGTLNPKLSESFTTPESYEALLATVTRWVEERITRETPEKWGLCICMPGLIDNTQQKGLLSPNVHLTDGRFPAADLTVRLGIPCQLIHEQHALCLAERYFGAAQGLDDFALMDLSTGVALPVVSHGQLFTGHRGLAGELGHITVNLQGRLCGCGNTGCLETEVSDPASLRAIHEALGSPVSFEEALLRLQNNDPLAWEAMQARIEYLAIGIAAAIHLFNPPTLFLNSRFLRECPAVLEHLQERLVKRTLPPLLADCRILLAQSNKQQGVIAGMIEHLTNARLPTPLHELHRLAPLDKASHPLTLS